MATSTWNIDPAHSSIGFAVKHAMVSTVRGRFDKVTGTLHTDENDPTKSSVEATVDAASINTGDDKRDGHLKSPDFFDVATYPTLTFKSTKVERKGKDEYRLLGDLSMHGVTRPVEFDFTFEGAGKDPWGGQRAGFEASATISRKDFGMTFNMALEAGGWLVSDKVKLELDIEAAKETAQQIAQEAQAEAAAA